MKKSFLILTALCMMSLVHAETVTRSFYFDFGMSQNQNTVSPDVNNNHWNNISSTAANASFDLIDAMGAATTLVLTNNTGFSSNGGDNAKGGGLLEPSAELLGDLAIATATQDYFFAEGSVHATFTISGLDPAKGYQFKILGSRNNTNVRISDYTLRGAWAVQGSLMAAGAGIGANGENQNTNNVYLSPVMRPNAEGKISLSVHRNYSASGAYFPINCMRMQEMTNLHEVDHEMYIDCGHSDGSNGELTTSPDAGGIYWNNLYENGTSAAAVNLVYTNGASTGANVTITSAFQRNGYNNGGNIADTYSSLLGAFGKKSVMGDYFFISGSNTGKMKFAGLNPNKAYVFYIIGSRAYNSSFGQTVDKLQLTGWTNCTFTHHTGGNGMCYSGATNGWNEDAFSVSEPVFPTAEGELVLSLSAERGSYVHINGIRIEEYSDYVKPTAPVVLMKGTAVEGNSVTMNLLKVNSADDASYETFCQLTNGGTLSFETDAHEVLSSGTCDLETGIYRIVYSTATKTYESLKITRVGLVGNVTSAGWDAAGDELAYQGNGVWSATLDLPAYTGSDAERGQFCMNSSWDYTIKARNGVEGVVGFTPNQADCGFSVSDINIRHGKKVVTLDMQQCTYSFECADGITDNKITFFGSSVCNGQGASEVDYVKHGYAWQYGQLLAARHAADNTLPEYVYSNASINGNNTINLLARYKGHMYGDCGEYVVIGLGLGNEGIHGAANPQAIYNQWKTNMAELIALAQAENKVVVATNNYPRGDYNATDYGYVKQMNLEMHEWNIPTVNFLGALDNCEGNGQWAAGYQNGEDIYHPTEAGHTEFMHAIVPSLFDALEAGKAKPTRQTGEGMVLAADKKIVLTPEDEVHSFSLAFRVKNISALNLNWALTAGTAPMVESSLTDENWHTVFVSHYYAAGKTYVYMDGVQQSVTDGQMLLDKVEISGACTISDLHFWRSGMNADEVAAWQAGKMLCSSLEIYCPLNNDNTANLAQSTNTIQLITEDEPVVPATYYIAGSGDAFGNWSPNAVALTDGEISFTNLAADWYEFKITDGTWNNQWGYSELDIVNSSPMHKTYGSGNNICFRLQAAADVTVKMVNNQVVLLIDREYCITGNKELVGGNGWAAITDKTLTSANNYTYTFYNLSAGDYRFKVKERADAWNDDCTWGYAHLDTENSNIGGDWDGDDHNIGFHLDAPADVTIALVNNEIRLNTKPVYFVTGDLGTGAWDPAEAARRLDSETYDITFHDVTPGTYIFLITNGTWGLKLNYNNVDKEASSNGIFNNGGDDQNIKISLDQTADVTVALDPVTSKITVTSSVGYFSCEKYSVVGWHLFAEDWKANDTETEMTDMGDGTYQYTLSNKYLTAADYGFRVVGNHNWNVQYPLESVGEPRVSIPQDGIYTIVFSFNPTEATPTYTLLSQREVTISEYQYSTFYSDKAFDVPEGLTAYIFTGVENDLLVMQTVNPIPANTGVVLYGTANQAYTLMQTQTDVTYPDNLLHGTINDETIDNANVHYILSRSSQNEFGFFWPYNTDHGVGAFTNHGGKAYLELSGNTPAPSRIRGFILTPSGTTDVEAINAPETENACYDVLGRKVAQPQQSGIYIMNGKKVIIF